MANYHCAIRTNYFHVKDSELFHQFMARVYGTDSSVELWEGKDADHQAVFAFGSYGEISGLRDALDVDEAGYDVFIRSLQQHIREDDAVVILEVGREKLRYLVGSAEIITCSSRECLDISDLAQARAATMLGTPGWQTQFDN